MSDLSSSIPLIFLPEPLLTLIEESESAVRLALDLRDNENSFELPGPLFEQLPFAIYVCDSEGFVRRYNRRAAELWGRSPKLHDNAERFCGSYRLFRPDGRFLPHDQCPMADVLRTGVSVREQEVHIERPDGSRGIALVDIEAVLDSGGNIVGAVNCFQDITERRRTEATALGLAAIIRSSDDAIIGTDLDGTVTSWNGAAERIFGYMAEEIIGNPFFILVPSLHQKEEETTLGRIQRDQHVGHYQTTRQRNDGTLIDISLTVSLIRNAHGEIIGASKIARDITEQKRSEAQIIHLAREAEHRTKNILATVLATVRLSRSDSSDGLKQLIEGRINALSKVNGLFVQSRWEGADIRTVATQELLPYCGETETRVWINGPFIMLEPNMAQAIAMSLHELATNSAKYGSLLAANGRVDVSWSRTANGRLSLQWTEAGGPTVTPPTHRGFGTRIVESLIGQFRGKVHFDWRDQGLECKIDLLLS